MPNPDAREMAQSVSHLRHDLKRSMSRTLREAANLIDRELDNHLDSDVCSLLSNHSKGLAVWDTTKKLCASNEFLFGDEVTDSLNRLARDEKVIFKTNSLGQVRVLLVEKHPN